MSRLRLAGMVLGGLGVALLGIGALRLFDGSETAASSDAATTGPSITLRSTRAAGAPFSGLQEARIEVGGRTLRVVLARSEVERREGLRQRRDLGPYAGMLFVFPAPTTVAFTMSTVPVALDIGFYGDDGTVVTTLRMEPCPGPESQCPLYESTGRFRYALETPAGALPPGPLG